MIAVEFFVFFLFFLVLGYLLPAGRNYWWYYLRSSPSKEARRIQKRRPTRKQIEREVKLSLQSVLIWAVMATVLFQFYKAGATPIYLHFRDYPLWYFPVSIFACFVIHDSYFYWTHRLMHWRPIFRYFHLAHHRSIAPTPWAILAFDPLEAVTQFLGIYLMVFLLPLHPLALLAFLVYDTEVNTAGHTGYEVLPASIARHWLYRGLNTVRHHDAHHTNMRVNFGSFFNVWDRWCGTFFDVQEPLAQTAEDRRAQIDNQRADEIDAECAPFDRSNGHRRGEPACTTVTMTNRQLRYTTGMKCNAFEQRSNADSSKLASMVEST